MRLLYLSLLPEELDTVSGHAPDDGRAEFRPDLHPVGRDQYGSEENDGLGVRGPRRVTGGARSVPASAPRNPASPGRLHVRASRPNRAVTRNTPPHITVRIRLVRRDNGESQYWRGTDSRAY